MTLEDLELLEARGLEAEPEVLEFIKTIPKGSIFYDLGACVGGFSCIALIYGLKVVAFEVENANYEGLLRNYEQNKHLFEEGHFFKPIQIGVADHKGKLMLRIGQPQIGGHHKTLAVKHYSAVENIIGGDFGEVDVNTLDNLIKEHNLPFPDYLKVDIDGSKYDFIQGAKNTLSKIKGIIIELTTENEYYSKIVEELNNLGLYEVSRGKIIDAGGLCNIVFERK